MYTPVNPSFTVYKWGLRGQNYMCVFVMLGTFGGFLKGKGHNL